MTTHDKSRLLLKKKPLFKFTDRSEAKRVASTDPTTLTVTLTSNVTIFLINK